jgi:hypothetical protein
VRTSAEAVADGHPHRVHAIDHLGPVRVAAAHVHVHAARVAVAAGLAQCRAGVQVARGRDEAFGDRAGQAGVPAGDVAHGREASTQCGGEPAGPGQGDVAQRAALDAEHVQGDAVRVEVRVDQSG